MAARSRRDRGENARGAEAGRGSERQQPVTGLRSPSAAGYLSSQRREINTMRRRQRSLALALGLGLLLLLSGDASAKKSKKRTGSKKKDQPPEGRPGGPGGRGRGPPGMGEPYVDPKTVPDPEPDPTAFLVDFEVEGTVDGVRHQPIGTFTLKVSPNWAPIGVERMRLVRLTYPRWLPCRCAAACAPRRETCALQLPCALR